MHRTLRSRQMPKLPCSAPLRGNVLLSLTDPTSGSDAGSSRAAQGFGQKPFVIRTWKYGI